ncbi:ESX secretion-associated protein EspG [Actinophytocola sediminis]
MVLPGPARLSARSLAWLLEVEQLGEPHAVLEPAAVWRPPTAADEARRAARAEIAALGWYDRSHQLAAEVAVALTRLCRGESEFFGWITRDRTTIGVLATGFGRHGLLAIRDGDSVWLRHVGRGALAESLVAQTPDVAAGLGKPVTVSRAELRGPARRRQITEAVTKVSPASSAARQVRRLMSLPQTGAGELYAAARDEVGRYRISAPVRYADTQHGRYLNLSTGPDQVLVAPARPADLVARLTGFKDERAFSGR